jgi:hypothetical protein
MHLFDLIEALAGTAVPVYYFLGAPAGILILKRVLDAPKEIRIHDRAVRNLDEDLALAGKGIDDRLADAESCIAASRGSDWHDHLPELLHKQALARMQAREDYRIEERRITRERELIRLSECLAHKALRLLTRRPFPQLTSEVQNLFLQMDWLGPAPDAPGDEQLLWHMSARLDRDRKAFAEASV